MANYTDQNPPTSDSNLKIALVAAAVVALLVVMVSNVNSEQSRSVNRPSTYQATTTHGSSGW